MSGPNPDCLLRREIHSGHQLMGPGGAKPGAWCDGVKDPGLGSPVCPDCAAGKCGVCGRQALDPVTDLIVDCACPHDGAS